LVGDIKEDRIFIEGRLAGGYSGEQCPAEEIPLYSLASMCN